MTQRHSLLISFLILFIGFWYFDVYEARATEEAITLPEEYGQIINKIRENETGLTDTVLFLGDLMLARDVETKIKSYGVDYPFRGSKDLLDSRYVVANFESAISPSHRQTRDLAMRFSTSPESLSGLVEARVTHTSLANNHALDYGEVGFSNTREELSLRNITSFGQPRSVATSSVSIIKVDGVEMALIGLNTTNGALKETEWRAVLEYAEGESDLQVVYVHWGEEYALISNRMQQNFAHTLIDAGVDLIVGHHPHVVQEVESYDGKLIFYSLGNFIFDQYFSDEVQTGLVLRLNIDADKDSGFIELIPTSSKYTRAQPQLMDSENKELFLSDLATKSSQNLQNEIETGQIKLTW